MESREARTANEPLTTVPRCRTWNDILATKINQGKEEKVGGMYIDLFSLIYLFSRHLPVALQPFVFNQ